MQVRNKRLITEFYKKYSDAKDQLLTWLNIVEGAEWQIPQDIKKRFPKASIIGNKKVVFDIKFNKYRLLVKVSYKNKIVRILKIGTHKEYDKWDLSGE